ncbi:hypothetical protein C8J34_1156 [Rhizobium sp. PP-F2F-G36]|nr:hypothetical protein C8J34_1156 [Rhizobium sp. PP-F2F-G36]
MSEKHKKIYHALVDGATDGLSGQQLYDYVAKQVPKTLSKKIVRAALLALTDPDVTDKHVLDVIYALAIRHRLDSLGIDTDDEEEAPAKAEPALLKKSRKKLAADVSPTSLIA